MSEDITLNDLVEQAYEGLELLLEAYDLEPEVKNIAAFTIVYGVHTPNGDIAVNHATPLDFRFDTPIVLQEVAEELTSEIASEIGRNN